MMSSISETNEADLLEKIIFRRQFVLGPVSFRPTKFFDDISLSHYLILSYHQDLSIISESTDDTRLTLIGTAVDPFSPEKTNHDILRSLLSKATDIDSILASSTPLSGRWLIIYQDSKETYIIPDPCCLRTAYYLDGSDEFWCGSQPEIIKANHHLTFSNDPHLLSFLLHPHFTSKESAWVGSKSIYQNCFRLQANHYLSVNCRKQVRFYPKDELPELTVNEIVSKACSILQGTFEGITRQHNVIQALTAGWDSRVLLAASRQVSSEIDYYMDRQGRIPEHHPDVIIPKLLSNKLHLNFVVKNSHQNVPGWFVSALSSNVTGGRVLPKTRNIFSFLLQNETRIRINGNVSEICRNFYEKANTISSDNVHTKDLSHVMGYGDDLYALEQIQSWHEGIKPYLNGDISILDLFFWEQDTAIWGALYPAEEDIAIEEFSPFNCRDLLNTLLAAPKQLRSEPDFPLYTRLIQEMWPEVLAFPINKLPGKPFFSIDLGIFKKAVQRFI